MKRLLIALTMIAALGLPAESYAQKSGQKAKVSIVAHTGNDSVSINAYSDTTSIDTSSDDDEDDKDYTNTVNTYSLNGGNFMQDMMRKGYDGMVGAIIIILILFLISPLAVIGLICYFIYKWRKQKLQLAEMAMKNGQPIPNDVKPDTPKAPEDFWRDGIKKVSIGLGIAVVGVLCFDSWGIAGIGLFVAIYGAGQIVIAKTSAAKQAKEETLDGDDTELTDKDF